MLKWQWAEHVARKFDGLVFQGARVATPKEVSDDKRTTGSCWKQAAQD
ncbi:jg18930, partial [Pararge aegeria aegeria]